MLIRSDFRRPFEVAVTSTRLLGIASTGFGLVMLFVFGYFNKMENFRIHFKVLSAAVWLLPGVAFLLAAILMKDRRTWAVRVAMVTAAVQLVMALALFIANFMFSPISAIPVLLCGLWCAALVQLIQHLHLALRSFNQIDRDDRRGFETIPSAPMRVIPFEHPSKYIKP